MDNEQTIGLIPSTIFWKNGITLDVWLSLSDTQNLVQKFIQKSTEIVNVAYHPNADKQSFFLHIDVQSIQAILEGDQSQPKMSVDVKPKLK